MAEYDVVLAVQTVRCSGARGWTQCTVRRRSVCSNTSRCAQQHTDTLWRTLGLYSPDRPSPLRLIPLLSLPRSLTPSLPRFSLPRSLARSPPRSLARSEPSLRPSVRPSLALWSACGHVGRTHGEVLIDLEREHQFCRVRLKQPDQRQRVGRVPTGTPDTSTVSTALTLR